MPLKMNWVMGMFMAMDVVIELDFKMINFIINALGWVGTSLFILAYYFVSNKKLDGSGATFQWMNLIGSLCLGINVFYKHVWSAVTLEVIWSSIAIMALIRIAKIR